MCRAKSNTRALSVLTRRVLLGRNMKNGIRNILIAMSFLAMGVAHSSDWQQFSASSSAKGFTDYGRIKRDNYGVNTYTAWWRAELFKTATAGGKTYKSHLSLYRVDCNKSTLTTLAAHYYDARGVETFTEPGEGAPAVAIPDSTGETFVNAICSAAKIRGL